MCASFARCSATNMFAWASRVYGCGYRWWASPGGKTSLYGSPVFWVVQKTKNSAPGVSLTPGDQCATYRGRRGRALYRLLLRGADGTWESLLAGTYPDA